MGHMVQIAKQLAKQQGIGTKGYRVVINCGPQGGQWYSICICICLAGENFPAAWDKLTCCICIGERTTGEYAKDE